VKTEGLGQARRRRRRTLEGPAVVTLTTEDDKHPAVRRAAEVHARSHGCVLILYAADAASIFADPMPNEWDSDGEVERFGDRLNADDLDYLGRSAIAGQVREGERAGSTTSAWLPKDKGVEALARYASAEGAHIVFVPESLESIEKLAALLAAQTGTGGSLPAIKLEAVPDVPS
jgi:hypothetical protein